MLAFSVSIFTLSVCLAIFRYPSVTSFLTFVIALFWYTDCTVAVALAAVRKGSAKGTNDQQDKANTRTITAPALNTTLYLTPDEAFNLVNNNATVKDEVAAGIYFKDIGSRKNLTVAQSDVEYACLPTSCMPFLAIPFNSALTSFFFNFFALL